MRIFLIITRVDKFLWLNISHMGAGEECEAVNFSMIKCASKRPGVGGVIFPNKRHNFLGAECLERTGGVHTLFFWNSFKNVT
jgi:hypothetical protein